MSLPALVLSCSSHRSSCRSDASRSPTCYGRTAMPIAPMPRRWVGSYPVWGGFADASSGVRTRPQGDAAVTLSRPNRCSTSAKARMAVRGLAVHIVGDRQAVAHLKLVGGLTHQHATAVGRVQ